MFETRLNGFNKAIWLINDLDRDFASKNLSDDCC